MSLNLNKIVIFTLVFIGIVTAIFMIKKIWDARCAEGDKQICTLLAQLEMDDTTRMHGTYTEIHSKTPLFIVEWAIDKTSQEMLRTDVNDETMHLIYAGDNFYLRDYSDTSWWKQSAKDVERFDIKLPFEPTTFFNNLIEDIQDPQNSLSYTHQDVCGAETCIVFTLKKENQQEVIQFFLAEATDQVQQIVIIDENIEQKVVFDYEDFEIHEPTSEIKTASSTQNIFLENFLQQSSVQKAKPEYVKEFEEMQSQQEPNSSPNSFDIPTISP